MYDETVIRIIETMAALMPEEHFRELKIKMRDGKIAAERSPIDIRYMYDQNCWRADSVIEIKQIEEKYKRTIETGLEAEKELKSYNPHTHYILNKRYKRLAKKMIKREVWEGYYDRI